ncbi:MAG: hypothetical protein J6T67_03040 [Paludibacteraceae bacterium]|nr:hypothetical protein [Paludibacteraceae bacterium]MBR5375201.1 hypothetical protein [Paludibacteraceae bacterium]
MKRCFLAIIVLLVSALTVTLSAQKKVNGKVLTEVKEWRLENGKKKIDHVTKYDAQGNKTEEIEYTKVGDQKSRTVYKYNEKGKCIEEQHFDEFNKLEKTVQYQYNEFGKKQSARTLFPNGKLKSEKVYEYITE